MQLLLLHLDLLAQGIGGSFEGRHRSALDLIRLLVSSIRLVTRGRRVEILLHPYTVADAYVLLFKIFVFLRRRSSPSRIASLSKLTSQFVLVLPISNSELVCRVQLFNLVSESISRSTCTNGSSHTDVLYLLKTITTILFVSNFSQRILKVLIFDSSVY